MPTSAHGSSGRDSAMRIMIIDDHEISRAAICALLRAEGIDVVADFNTSGHALAAARALHPEVVIVDVAPAADTGFGIARGLCGLPAPPVVILTSSADRVQFGAKINSYRFVAKADITATVIASLANTPPAGQAAGTPAKPGRENEWPSRPPSHRHGNLRRAVPEDWRMGQKYRARNR
jgi:CheY-like chemotaxis protein